MLLIFSPAECQKIQSLREELLNLNTIISKPAKDLSSCSIAEFERRTRQWGENFVAVYRRKYVTPYIHALMNHVGEFMKMHGSIIPFTQQGLEKKNNVLIKSHFWSSSHQGEAALWQILEKQNRIEHLESIGMKEVKVFDIHCSNCNNKGHKSANMLRIMQKILLFHLLSPFSHVRKQSCSMWKGKLKNFVHYNRTF